MVYTCTLKNAALPLLNDNLWQLLHQMFFMPQSVYSLQHIVKIKTIHSNCTCPIYTHCTYYISRAHEQSNMAQQCISVLSAVHNCFNEMISSTSIITLLAIRQVNQQINVIFAQGKRRELDSRSVVELVVELNPVQTKGV